MKYILTSLIILMASSFVTSTSEGSQYVYICTGPKAYSYHRHSRCNGLNNCQADIKKVTIEYARAHKRRPCKICY